MASSTRDVLREVRATRRVTLIVEISCLSKKTFGFGITENISEQGVLINTPHTLLVNSEVETRFCLFVDSSVLVVQTRGRVAWVRPGTMMGIQFLDLPEECRLAIARFVEEN